MPRRRTVGADLRAEVGPVPRKKVADQILAALRTEIVTGAIPRGARLPAERELAERFAVSGPTVREAIRGLAALGLVQVRHGSGVYVVPDVDAIVALSLGTLMQLEDVGIEDLIGLIGVLNVYAAGLSVDRAADEEIAALRAAAEATTSAETVAEVAAAVTHFLTGFATASHDRLLAVLIRFLVHLVVQLQISSHETESDGFWRHWAAQTGALRLAVVDRLEQRDRPGVERAVDACNRTAQEQIRTIPALRDARFSDTTLAGSLGRIIDAY